MALEFTTTRQSAKVRGVKVLVHGRAGAGKTVLCRTAPAPIILSAEAGLLSLADTDIPVITIRNLADLDEAYQFIAYSQHAKQFKTACLDSVSEIAEQCLGIEKQKSKDPRKAYGEMQDEVLKRIRWFRDLQDWNVYFSCKQGQSKDEVTGAMLYGPKMPGQQLGPALPYMFDEILALQVGRAQDGTAYRYLQTFLDFQYDAKDRSGMLDPYEPPDLTHVFNKIALKAA